MRDSLQRHRSLRALVALGIIALVIYIIQAIWSALAIVGDVFLIFLLAWIVTFILAPLSSRLERLGVYRVAAVSVIYLALLAVGIGVASLAVPVVEAEISHLATRMSVALSPHAVVTPPSQLLIKMAIAGLLLGAAQHIVLNVIAPRIFGQHMRAPTLILFAALLLGAGEGGVWGAFFAGPVVAVAYAMLEVFYERFSADSPLFQDDDEDDDGASDAPRVNGASAAKPAPPGQWQPSRPTDSAPAIEGPPQRTNALQPPNASDSQPVNHNA